MFPDLSKKSWGGREENLPWLKSIGLREFELRGN
jgi:hypothetical protein